MHERARHTPKKSLGQNFLTTDTYARRLVEAAAIGPNDVVVEVGPGTGMVTRILLERALKVIAVEKDATLVPRLREECAAHVAQGTLSVVEDDILHFDPAAYGLGAGEYSIVGSLPYYITGIFFRTMLSLARQPSRIAIIIQKEVAERMVAKDGKESILSISVKCYGNPRYIATIKAGAFYPRPKVDSAIILVEGISRDFFAGFSEEEFFRIVKAAFASKRKKMLGNLTILFPRAELEVAFQMAGISPDARAEDISVEAWKKLVNILTKDSVSSLGTGRSR